MAVLNHGTEDVSQLASQVSVFLNVPYDLGYERLLVSLVAGLSAFGLVPRLAADKVSSQRRLDRITALLVEQCAKSIHDVSRIEAPQGLPRFNMPFELGLAVGLGLSTGHQWWVIDSSLERPDKTLSDLKGTDPLAHNDSPRDLLACLLTLFVRPDHELTIRELTRADEYLWELVPEIKASAGSPTLFGPVAFRRLVLAANRIALWQAATWSETKQPSPSAELGDKAPQAGQPAKPE